MSRDATIRFYDVSFEATSIINLEVIESSYQSGDYLEQAVLAELRGETEMSLLKKSLRISEENVEHLRRLETTLGELAMIAETNEVEPNFEEALSRILKDHSPVRRVDLETSRFAMIANGETFPDPADTLGTDLVDLLRNIREDVGKVIIQTERMNEEFRNTLPFVEDGGFAALVLSGRSTFPEQVMLNAQVVSDLKAYYDAACLATIAATMNSYPMGLDWLRTPNK